MIIILLSFLFGIILGYLARNTLRVSNIASKLVDTVLCCLLFVLGLSIGMNDEIIENLLGLGFAALILASGAIAGSILLTIPLNKLIIKE